MSVAPVSPLILTFPKARHVVEEHAARIPEPANELVDLLAAHGRVLAEPVLADRDIPPFPRSTRDGYAILSAHLTQVPAAFEVVGEVKAGEKLDNIPARLEPGQAVSIMTGAPVPAGADAVVMVEFTTTKGSQVEVSRRVIPGENIVPCGAEARQGSTLLSRGTRLNEIGIGLAASAGKSRVQVYRRPQVAVLTTGDEIVGIAATPGPTQIRNSNSYSLAVQILRAGGQPRLLPIAPDESDRLRRLIELGMESDLLLMTGGVSMGRYDLVEQVFSELGAEFFFTGAQIQPGRPVVFGRCGAAAEASTMTYFFGLPGNPVSTMVTFELFVRPMIEALAGQTGAKLTFVHARLRSDVRVKTGLTRFLPALLTGEFENSAVELIPWQGSGDIAATARSNCFLVVPSNRDHIAAGEWVAVLQR